MTGPWMNHGWSPPWAKRKMSTPVVSAIASAAVVLVAAAVCAVVFGWRRRSSDDATEQPEDPHADDRDRFEPAA